MLWIHNGFGKKYKNWLLYPHCLPTPFNQKQDFQEKKKKKRDYGGAARVRNSPYWRLEGWEMSEWELTEALWGPGRGGEAAEDLRHEAGLANPETIACGFGEAAICLLPVGDFDDSSWPQGLGIVSALQDIFQPVCNRRWASSILKKEWAWVRESSNPGSWWNQQSER